MKKHCLFCKKEINTTSVRKKFCSNTCKKLYYSYQHFPDGSDYVECKECGIREKQLVQHIIKVHHITVDEYCIKHNCLKNDLTCKSLHDQMSVSITKACKEGRCGWQKGGKNPSHSDEYKSGRKSAWSMNFKGYDGLSDDEKRQKIKELSNKVVDKMNSNSNNPLRIDYYTSRGYSLSEAKQMLKDRQTTFTLEKCIEKYGKEKGQEIFEARQKKWQDTLNAKPQEEKDRINKLKAKSTSSVVGYSKISQELFDSIYEKIKDEYDEIFYATHNLNDCLKNNEYEVVLEDGIHRYFLDFYIKDNNKVIEFDGDYWHGEKRGNQLRDKQRENDLIELGYVNILHVKERDYKNNPQAVVDECLNFIRK